MKKPVGFKIYEERFGPEGHTNDIHDFTHPINGIKDIAEHDLLVVFPAKTTVARTVSGELGIEGEKGNYGWTLPEFSLEAPRPK